MKNSKRLTLLTLILTIMVLIIPVTANSYNVGDVIGYAQPTDIIATINGYQLNSYNVGGFTYIVVEDLRYFGIDVIYDNNSRSLAVTRNPAVSYIDPAISNPEYTNIGTNSSYLNILYTDIVTYVNGNYVNSYNINGATIIKFDELAHFGQIIYDNAKREISLTIAGVNTNPIASLTQAFESVFQSSMANLFNSTYKTYAPNASCNTIVRTKGNIIAVDFYIYGYNLTATQITSEKQGCLDTHADMTVLVNQLKASCPTFCGFLINMYDGTGTCVVTHLYN